MLFKENFNRICREKGTSPTRLVMGLGLSNSKVAAWNKGHLPKEELMIRMARELGVPVSDFFAVPSSDAPDARTLTEDEQDILRVYRSLPRKEQHTFMAHVYALEDSADS